MQNSEIILNNLIMKVKKGEVISPFLFLSENNQLLNSDIENIAIDLLKYFKVPLAYFFKMEDNNEKIKISEIKEFLSQSNLGTPYKIQIFFIKNISRMTL